MYDNSVFDVLRGLTDQEIEDSITVPSERLAFVDPVTVLGLREMVQPGYLTPR